VGSESKLGFFLKLLLYNFFIYGTVFISGGLSECEKC
jgi:hypothetical protein